MRYVVISFLLLLCSVMVAREGFARNRGSGPQMRCIDVEEIGVDRSCEAGTGGDYRYEFYNECTYEVFVSRRAKDGVMTGTMVFPSSKDYLCGERVLRWCAARVGESGCN